MSWAYAAATVRQTLMLMAFATTKTTALVRSMRVAFATGQVKSTRADVLTSPMVIVTAMATK